MIDFLIGLGTTAAVILFLEIFKKVDRKIAATLTLSGIAFIYLGFSKTDPQSLVITISGAAFFFALAYLGYRKNFAFILIGLFLHGVWDFVFPFFSSVAPHGYDVFCITIDFLLVPYFYLRVSRPMKNNSPVSATYAGQ